LLIGGKHSGESYDWMLTSINMTTGEKRFFHPPGPLFILLLPKRLSLFVR
jgi:hypothetical protein